MGDGAKTALHYAPRRDTARDPAGLGSACVNTVLRDVVESARAPAGARYGTITTIEDAGQPQEFVTSAIRPDEHQQMLT